MFDVLVADDEATTRIALKALLERAGYRPTLVNSGSAAWEVLSGANPPPIAVLDWEMPGHTGPEICRLLAAREGDAPFVYTVLLTGQTGESDIVSGFEAGANDYMCKPFNAGEFRSRIGAAARIVHYEQELRASHAQMTEYAAQMERLAEQRAKQLVHADRMVTLGTMAAGVAHEINNPTSFISGNIQTIEMFWKDMVPVLDQVAPGAGGPKLAFIKEEMPKVIAEMRSGVTRISKIVNSLRGFSHAGSDSKAPVDLNACVNEALLLCRNQLKHGVKTTTELLEGLPTVTGDATQLSQVLVNLFTNAAHAMEPKGGELHVHSLRQNGNAVLRVRDTGQGIAPENVERVFLPFFTTKEVGKGTGLGLPICQRIIEDHGGSIEVANHPTGGAEFTIALPIRGD